ncbi:hypothetical protein INR49_016426 [Caranx melampygus]|nr:hypothetical protein INR49_016426 [Caranx melampygus]
MTRGKSGSGRPGSSLPKIYKWQCYPADMAVHSAHVLQSLNDQRQQDVLCDVTVVVENRSFRAHSSVLASCSGYFHSKITNVTTQNSIITLPDEVTVEGFEPLLQFAYTSKLLFTKENIHAIHSSAEFLGFQDLESACFDFLIPKFSEGKRNSQEARRRTCCRSRDPSASFGSSVESSQPKSFESHSSVPSVGDVNLPELIEPAGRDVKQTVETVGAETNCNPGSCPLNTSGAESCSQLLEQTEAGLEERMAGDLPDPTLTALSHEEGFGERSSVEREVAEHLAKGFWPDLCPSQAQPLPLDPMDQNSLAKASDFHWLKQLDLSSSAGDCPFLRDLGTNDDPAPRADTLSQSEKSPYMSSSVNSGDDSDLDTDGDTEANNKRAAEIQLPFPVEQISTLTRSAFQQLLRHHNLTQDQLEFVHDVRRRSKNRVAAQRCRKRKLDSIHQLECEIKRLKSEKERLLREQTELEQNLEETRQSLCGLCKSVSIESGSEQDHLQLLAKLSSSDFPMSSPSLAGKDEESEITIEMDESLDLRRKQLCGMARDRI